MSHSIKWKRVSVSLPEELLDLLDGLYQIEYSDRSEAIRRGVRLVIWELKGLLPRIEEKPPQAIAR